MSSTNLPPVKCVRPSIRTRQSIAETVLGMLESTSLPPADRINSALPKLRTSSGALEQAVPPRVKVGEYFSRVVLEGERAVAPDYTSKDHSGQAYSWYRGLNRNAEFNIGSRRIFLTDNPNYATAYILRQVAAGHIKAGASLIEMGKVFFDQRRSKFSSQHYMKISGSEDIAHCYLLKHLDPDAGPSILAREGLVSETRRVMLQPNTAGERGWRVIEGGPQAQASLSQKVPFDIVSINLGILSLVQESRTGSANIEWPILEKLLDVESLAARATVVTISTNPGFINQNMALIFAKRVVSMIAGSPEPVRLPDCVLPPVPAGKK